MNVKWITTTARVAPYGFIYDVNLKTIANDGHGARVKQFMS